MKKAKIIRIFLVPHVEVRIHVSKEMEEDYKKCYLSGRMYRFRYLFVGENGIILAIARFFSFSFGLSFRKFVLNVPSIKPSESI